ncbi:MAG TPA: ribonuclease HII [Deltaproteobacteria bacterium]|nr:ribonuclease HII [Deltaproteobacteria bacterium]
MICGVDEAGKGAVLGPMVIAGVLVHGIEECEGLGFMDSKTLSKQRREELYDLITAYFMTAVRVIDAQYIDQLRIELKTGMNTIVATAHAAVIDELDAQTAFVDACDVNARRYGETITALLRTPCTIISEHKADRQFPVVSAASIVAKVTRDRIIDTLSEEYGAIGSGYPSDRVTIDFIEAWISDNGSPPPFARRSWRTVSDITARLSQSTLFDF